MGLVTLDQDADNLVSGSYSTARGAVMRSEKQEITRAFFRAGEGAHEHAHPEEQTFYVVSGRLRVTLRGEEPYEVAAGQCSFHPSNVPHRVEALEDTVAISFKNLVDPIYEATGKLA